MSKAKNSKALNDAELDQLSDFLDQFPGSMNLEVMDGFFAALICAPQLPPMNEAFRQVLGEKAEFAGYDEAQQITSLLVRHWNTIATTLNGPDIYFPLLLQDEAGNASANDWAQGFYRGMEFSGGWDELMSDEEQGGWILPILALVHEHDPDPEMRPGIIDDERRQEMLVGMIAGLKKIYAYFAPHRRDAVQSTTTITRSTPKIGRNDPCPCGSGRKYKQCCAGKTPVIH